MDDKLILLERKTPPIIEIHRGEIKQTENLLFKTTDMLFAKRFVEAYNNNICWGAYKDKWLVDSLRIYLKEKHTQEECIGYIDGFNQALSIIENINSIT